MSQKPNRYQVYGEWSYGIEADDDPFTRVVDRIVEATNEADALRKMTPIVAYEATSFIWEVGPEITLIEELPEDQWLARLGAARLPGME